MAAVVVPIDLWSPGNPVNYLMGIGNQAYNVYNSGAGYRIDSTNTYAITSPRPGIIHFEVHPGDTQWSDVGSGKERSEIGTTEAINYHTPTHVSYQFTLDPGDPSTATFLILGQFHQANPENSAQGLPIFAFNLHHGKLWADIRYSDPSGAIVVKSFVLDPNGIVRGQSYDMDVYANFSDDENGRLVVVRDGKSLLDYHGPIGHMVGGGVYWQEGLYRSHTTQTISATYGNLTIDHGDMVQIPPAGTTGVSLASAPTMTLAEGHVVGSGAAATLDGIAPAGASIRIYDGDSLVTSTTAGGDGGFLASLNLSAGSHLFTAVIVAADGSLSRTSAEVPVEVGTAADIMARMNFVSQMSGIAAIVLTDTHTLQLAKVADMQALIANGGHALSTIVGGYNFGIWSGAANNRVFTSYDAAGTAIESFQSSVAGGQVARMTHMINNPDSFIQTEYFEFHIAGQSYSSAYRAFTAGMKQVALIQYHDDNSLAYASFLHVDGSRDVQTFDQYGVIQTNVFTASDGTLYTREYAGGAIAREYTTYTDGTVTDGVPSLIPFDADLGPGRNAPSLRPPAAGTAAAHMGDDTYVVMGTGVPIAEQVNGGNDIVYTTLRNYALPDNVEALIYTGTGDATLTGNALANAITGGSGNDMIDGVAGADTLSGGLGDDTYLVHDAAATIVETAGAGIDTIRTELATYTLGANIENLAYTGAGGAALTGNTLANMIVGGGGNDMIDGVSGADTLVGGLGDDMYFVHDATATIVEAAGGGIDTVRTELAVYALGDNVENLVFTGTGGGTLTGNALANMIAGGTGNDLIDGVSGSDTLSGGLGDDTYVIHDAAARIVESAGGGIDTVRTDLAGYALASNVENLVFIGSGGASLTGNVLANTITGGGGNDQLNGQAGADMMIGGGGDDTYIVDNIGDQTIEDAGGGTDKVVAAISWTLGANMEVLQLSGQAAINGTGNALDNQITGNNAANIIDGGMGADRMEGRAGDDVYVVDNAGDRIVEYSGGGIDSVRASVSYALAANVENLTLIGSGSIGGRGNELDNLLTGNDASNSLNGGAGNDRIDGGMGSDTLFGGTGNDTFIFSTPFGTKNVDTIGDFTPGEDRIQLSSAIFGNLGGSLTDAMFKDLGAGGTLTADTHILYDPNTGSLSYDPDGVGSAPAVQFAVLTNHPVLHASDFLVI